MKPCPSEKKRKSHRCFPSPKGGGPIEASHHRLFPAPQANFPSPKGGGPIEARPVGKHDHRFHALSIAERRWPH